MYEIARFEKLLNEAVNSVFTDGCCNEAVLVYPGAENKARNRIPFSSRWMHIFLYRECGAAVIKYKDKISDAAGYSFFPGFLCPLCYLKKKYWSNNTPASPVTAISVSMIVHERSVFFIDTPKYSRNNQNPVSLT